MGMRVHMTQAGIGDCIVIELGKDEERKLTILLDTGNLKEEFPKVYNQYKEIDYFILSHDDADHYRGLLYLIRDLKKKNGEITDITTLPESLQSICNPDRILMNYGAKIEQKNEDDETEKKEQHLSAKEVEEIAVSLQELVNFNLLNEIVSDPNPDDPDELNIIQLLWRYQDGRLETERKRADHIPEVKEGYEHAELVILSPKKATLETYISKKWEEIRQAKEVLLKKEKKEEKASGEWLKSIQELALKYDSTDVDKKDANNASIAFLLLYEGKAYLFAADASPVDMVQSGKKYLNKYGNGKDSIEVEFIKMPHHGSSDNVTEEFLQLFPTNRYLISTCGYAQYKHPGKQALAMIANCSAEKDVYIYGNYDFWKLRRAFMEKELWKAEEEKCTITRKDKTKVTLHFEELLEKAFPLQDGVEISL